MRNLIVVSIIFTMFSCGSETSEKVTSEIDVIGESKKNEVKCNPEAEPLFMGYLESSLQLDGFTGSKAINYDKLKSEGYQFSGVEGETHTTQHVFNTKMQEFLIVKESMKSEIITEITLIGRQYITHKCIGVNSSVDEFINTYPEYEIGFDAGNDVFYLSTTELLGIKFNILTTFYTGSEGANPKTKYSKDNFQEGTSIVSITLADF